MADALNNCAKSGHNSSCRFLYSADWPLWSFILNATRVAVPADLFSSFIRKANMVYNVMPFSKPRRTIHLDRSIFTTTLTGFKNG